MAGTGAHLCVLALIDFHIFFCCSSERVCWTAVLAQSWNFCCQARKSFFLNPRRSQSTVGLFPRSAPATKHTSGLNGSLCQAPPRRLFFYRRGGSPFRGSVYPAETAGRPSPSQSSDCCCAAVVSVGQTAHIKHSPAEPSNRLLMNGCQNNLESRPLAVSRGN